MINLSDLSGSLLDFKGQTVVTPWDRLKKHIFESYPIHKTEKVEDFHELLLIGLKYQHLPIVFNLIVGIILPQLTMAIIKKFT